MSYVAVYQPVVEHFTELSNNPNTEKKTVKLFTIVNVKVCIVINADVR